jgi:hypothetical protein
MSDGWMRTWISLRTNSGTNKFIDIGIFSASVPEEYGGQGLCMVDNVIAFEQIY